MLSKALLLRFLLEASETTHEWKGKQLHNSFQEQDCAGKTNSFDDRLSREARSLRNMSCPPNFRLNGHQQLMHGLVQAEPVADSSGVKKIHAGKTVP